MCNQSDNNVPGDMLYIIWEYSTEASQHSTLSCEVVFFGFFKILETRLFSQDVRQHAGFWGS